MPTSLAEIKNHLDNKIGERVQLTQQVGRKRVVTRQGVLSETFPAVFVIELDQDENHFERMCYSYTDVLTEAVAIEFE
ncbi:Veg family protein [Aerococcus kribbianus]|uniref:Veg family protein n=1 Tax=Aerococcus kribbianus TaxID=2999064 RepID=A0A9X3FUS4_9LACT|nr:MULTISPECIES: Veg family protein [unclassified Aerococcus]MCZ0717311.1 Veg family protein [Aerococcus sp. YH-aer221]MCZ0725599.1 Veg family protein [Aerococcus sp. YH-aer222]